MSYEEGTTIHRSTIELLDKLYKALKQRDQYKSENEKLHKLKDIKENALKGSNFIIENQKATIKRLEEENEKLRKDNLELDDTLSVMSEDYSELSDKKRQLKNELKEANSDADRLLEVIEQFKHDLQYTEWEIVPHLKQENKALRLQSNTYFDEWQNVKKLYTTLTDHIRLKASANSGEHRYIGLVNFIDRLEKGEN